MPLVASLIVIFFFMAGAMTMLAENSLPGDTLYGFKLLTEDVRLAVLNDNGVLEQQFGQRRTVEIQQLMLLNRAADVTFQGEVQAINGTEWLVAGLQLEVSAGIPGADAVQTGDLVEIQGATTAEGQLIARAIRLIGHNQSLPSTILTPTFTPTIMPSSTLTATPTATIPTSTPAPTSTNSQTPVPSATTCVANHPEGWVIYSVQSGDSLSGLATSTGTTLEELMRVNCLVDRSLIVTGQQLFLPMTPTSIVTQTMPQVRPTTTSEDLDEQDNSGRSENSGSDSGDDEREGEDNSGSDDNGGDNSGRGGGDD
jgi:LysM repeat protein